LKSNRYKVWTRDPDGQPGTLLLRTGSSEQLDVDEEFVGTPEEVAIKAWLRCPDLPLPPDILLVKDFDTGICYTVNLLHGIVVEGWDP
jgi:hypothetical protein